MGKTKCERWMARGDFACRNCAGCRDPEPEAPEAEETDSHEDGERWFDVTVERRETAVKSHVFRVKARNEDEACDLATERSCEFDWGPEDIDWNDDDNEIADAVVSDNQEDE